MRYFILAAYLTPQWPVEGEAAGHTIPDFTFTNQLGDPAGAGDLEGKIYVANFFFSSCTTICPSMRTNLQAVQAAYRHDPAIRLLSHSVWPETDSVAALNAYAAVNDVVPGKWHLLTGTREALYAHARAAYFAPVGGGEAEAFLHTETFYLVDDQRRIRGVYNGTLPFDVERLIDDIAVLKNELAS